MEKLTDAVLDLYCFVKNNTTETKISKEEINSSDIYFIIENLKAIMEIIIDENIKFEKELNNLVGYEDLIKKLEADIRHHIKVEYEMKLHIEYLTFKLSDIEPIIKENKKLYDKLIKKENLNIEKEKDEEIKNLKDLLKTKEENYILKENEYLNRIKDLNCKFIRDEDIKKATRNSKTINYLESSDSRLGKISDRNTLKNDSMNTKTVSIPKRDLSEEKNVKINGVQNNIRNLEFNIYTSLKNGITKITKNKNCIFSNLLRNNSGSKLVIKNPKHPVQIYSKKNTLLLENSRNNSTTNLHSNVNKDKDAASVYLNSSRPAKIKQYLMKQVAHKNKSSKVSFDSSKKFF